MATNKQETFMAQYRKVHDAFVRYCTVKAYGIMEAEDLVSETVLRAYEKFSNDEQVTNFPGYLFGIAKNILNTKLRRKKLFSNYTEPKVELVESQETNPETMLDIGILYKAIDKLPTPQKEAIILFEISGFSIKEIMELQGAGESSVKQRLKRGREKLASLLGKPELKKEPLHLKSAILSVFI